MPLMPSKSGKTSMAPRCAGSGLGPSTVRSHPSRFLVLTRLGIRPHRSPQLDRASSGLPLQASRNTGGGALPRRLPGRDGGLQAREVEADEMAVIAPLALDAVGKRARRLPFGEVAGIVTAEPGLRRRHPPFPFLEEGLDPADEGVGHRRRVTVLVPVRQQQLEVGIGLVTVERQACICRHDRVCAPSQATLCSRSAAQRVPGSTGSSRCARQFSTRLRPSSA